MANGLVHNKHTMNTEHRRFVNTRRLNQIKSLIRQLPLSILMIILVLFLVSPMVAVVGASVGETAYLRFPPEGFTLKWYSTVLKRGEFVDSLSLSLWVAVTSATIAVTLGFLIALGLNSVSLQGSQTASKQHAFWAKLDILNPEVGGRVVRNFVLSPMMLPVIVLAVAYLHFFAMSGMSSSVASIFLSHLVLTLPFGVLLAEVGLGNVDPLYTRAAEGLGASRLTILRRVVLPLSKGGTIAGWAFAFVVSFGDSTIALLLQGPQRVTAPVEIFNRLYAAPFDPIVAAMAGIVTIITLFLLAVALGLAERGGGVFGTKRSN